MKAVFCAVLISFFFLNGWCYIADINSNNLSSIRHKEIKGMKKTEKHLSINSDCTTTKISRMDNFETESPEIIETMETPKYKTTITKSICREPETPETTTVTETTIKCETITKIISTHSFDEKSRNSSQIKTPVSFKTMGETSCAPTEKSKSANTFFPVENKTTTCTTESTKTTVIFIETSANFTGIESKTKCKSEQKTTISTQTKKSNALQAFNILSQNTSPVASKSSKIKTSESAVPSEDEPHKTIDFSKIIKKEQTYSSGPINSQSTTIEATENSPREEPDSSMLLDFPTPVYNNHNLSNYNLLHLLVFSLYLCLVVAFIFSVILCACSNWSRQGSWNFRNSPFLNEPSLFMDKLAV